MAKGIVVKEVSAKSVLKRVSDYVTVLTEVDEKVKILDILDTEVTIVSVDFLKGNKGTNGVPNEFCFIAFTVEGDKTLKGFSCGGAVVVRKMHEVCAAHGLPCMARFVQIGKYYDIV